jgi:hypothetical protein
MKFQRRAMTLSSVNSHVAASLRIKVKVKDMTSAIPEGLIEARIEEKMIRGSAIKGYSALKVVQVVQYTASSTFVPGTSHRATMCYEFMRGIKNQRCHAKLQNRTSAL